MLISVIRNLIARFLLWRLDSAMVEYWCALASGADMSVRSRILSRADAIVVRLRRIEHLHPSDA